MELDDIISYLEAGEAPSKAQIVGENQTEKEFTKFIKFYGNSDFLRANEPLPDLEIFENFEPVEKYCKKLPEDTFDNNWTCEVTQVKTILRFRKKSIEAPGKGLKVSNCKNVSSLERSAEKESPAVKTIKQEPAVVKKPFILPAVKKTTFKRSLSLKRSEDQVKKSRSDESALNLEKFQSFKEAQAIKNAEFLKNFPRKKTSEKSRNKPNRSKKNSLQRIPFQEKPAISNAPLQKVPVVRIPSKSRVNQKKPKPASYSPNEEIYDEIEQRISNKTPKIPKIVKSEIEVKPKASVLEELFQATQEKSQKIQATNAIKIVIQPVEIKNIIQHQPKKPENTKLEELSNKANQPNLKKPEIFSEIAVDRLSKTQPLDPAAHQRMMMQKTSNNFEASTSKAPTSPTLNAISTSKTPPAIEAKEKSTTKRIGSNELSPWTSSSDLKKFKRDNFKIASCYQTMLAPKNIIETFKCMDAACSFVTSYPGKFFAHLKRTHDRVFAGSFHRYCAYCTFKAPDTKEIVHHINDIHANDVYQCSLCFYRSREKESCSGHMTLHHKDEKGIIIKCGEDKVSVNKSRIIERLKIKRKAFVKPIPCDYCDASIFVLQEYFDHLDEHIRVLSERNILNEKDIQKKYLQVINSHENAMVQCIYCEQGCTDTNEMSNHLVKHHPSEYRYCCLRQRPPGYEQEPQHSVNSTIIYKFDEDEKIGFIEGVHSIQVI